MTEIPSLRALQVFEAVGRLGTATAAAAELCVSTGAVSQQIQHLEQSLSVDLFARQGRSLALTPVGQSYFKYVRFAFDQLRSAREDLQFAQDRPGIVIAAPYACIGWLQSSILAWRGLHPNASIRIVDWGEEIFQSNLIDFWLSSDADALPAGNFTELFTDHVVPACSTDFAAQRSIGSIAKILSSPLIHIEWDERRVRAPSWEDWARSVAQKPLRETGKLKFANARAAIQAALGDQGFVLVPVSMIEDELSAGRMVVPVERPLKMPKPYYLASTPAVVGTALGSDFHELVQGAAQCRQSLGAIFRSRRIAGESRPVDEITGQDR